MKNVSAQYGVKNWGEGKSPYSSSALSKHEHGYILPIEACLVYFILRWRGKLKEEKADMVREWEWKVGK